jgi:hypothetical protein
MVCKRLTVGFCRQHPINLNDSEAAAEAGGPAERRRFLVFLR